ncbi:hypothetical protein LU604_05780 [Erwinia tracheiphila]|uniref:Uncharacterized protein n=1 Tax=Erwinia tracheiphila TaxID=65700 RepID=A0A345CTR6_9GAMM|nr:hypothetical protein [Erwinia tracheiphila]AXF76833.1 hypothetical protein AV903_13535 [Erwinia tracheiphila]AXF78648.1 hypothetical protein AV903_25900 [Erwinia tracheiphila]UIA82613.1 hypothetical protein LU604_19225 [Erwinia tracheiphila]UIA84486.1 hypothetical protein LU604_05780 [Erwinia tracheiphila]UIA91201.1 hypothetical protein LU632_18755 [Erwinia tracheiphila]
MISLLRSCGGYIVAGIICLISGFKLGNTMTTARLMPQISAAERALSDARYAFSEDQKNAAELHNRTLREATDRLKALDTANEQLTADLYATTQVLAEAKQQYDRSIPDAIKNDGKTYTGLSPDSLRVYITAFGYETATGNNRLSPTTERHDSNSSQASTADIGKSPSTADTRQPLRGMEPESGEQAESHPALAGNQSGTE